MSTTITTRTTTPSSAKPRRTRGHRTMTLVAAVGVAVLGASTLAGCSDIANAFATTSEARYATYGEFSEDAELVFRQADWIPEDSTSIAVRFIIRESGNMLRFTSATGPNTEECVEGDLTGEPPLEAGWWPSTEPATGLVCGDEWQVFEQGGAWFAWTNAA